jgi:bifunctional DNA-binding transcriptional regulator/antitoxin component of YhaV-PrlF toxin-antitoxin module
MKTTSIIRNRGQLTIPDSVRKLVGWANPMSAVSIVVVNSEEIIIRPQRAQVDWDDIWSGITKARSIKGEGKVISATEFLTKDKASH